MLFIIIMAVAVLCQVWATAVEAKETRAWPRKSFGGLLLACGLFTMCLFVFA